MTGSGGLEGGKRGLRRREEKKMEGKGRAEGEKVGGSGRGWRHGGAVEVSWPLRRLCPAVIGRRFHFSGEAASAVTERGKSLARLLLPFVAGFSAPA